MATRSTAMSRGAVQPERLVSDVLLEIMSWLAYYDWLDLTSDDEELQRATLAKESLRPGYSLIRASHVCKYWNNIARSNRSLWCYIPLRETWDRPGHSLDREFGFRVQRSIGLSNPLYFSYTEFSQHETNLHRDYLEKVSKLVPPDSPIYGSPVHEWSFTAFRLWPLVKDCVKRSKVLILHAKGESLSEIFGYLKQATPHGYGSFNGRLMMGSFRVPKLETTTEEEGNSKIDVLEKLKEINTVGELNELEELVLDIDDRAYRFSFPLAPNLRSLKIKTRTLRDHIILPFSPTNLKSSLFPPRLTDAIASEAQGHTMPQLAEFEISAPYVNFFSLHYFLSDRADVLTCLTLAVSGDIMNPYDPPSRSIVLSSLKHLSISNFTSIIQRHIEMWHCPILESLSISLNSRLPITSSFNGSQYPNLKHLVFRYPPSRKATRQDKGKNLASYGIHAEKIDFHEQCDSSILLEEMLFSLDGIESLVVEGWTFGCQWEEEDWIQHLTPHRPPSSVSKPIAPPLPQKEPSSATEPIGALSSVRNRVRTMFMWQRISTEGHLLDIDGKPLELWEEDDLEGEIDPEADEEIERKWKEVVEGKVKDEKEGGVDEGSYRDGDVWARIGVRTDYRGSAQPPVIDEGSRTDDKTDDEGDWDPNSFGCRSLRSIAFKNCIGLEKTALFRCMQARSALSLSTSNHSTRPGAPESQTQQHEQVDKKKSEDSSPGKSKPSEEEEEEPPMSQSTTTSTLSRSSSRTSAALSSNPSSPGSVADEDHTPTPITRPLPPVETAIPGAVLRTAVVTTTSTSPILPTRMAAEPPTCHPLMITLKDCGLTQNEFDDLYTKYETHEYVIPKAEKPREPTPIPPDQRFLWI